MVVAASAAKPERDSGNWAWLTLKGRTRVELAANKMNLESFGR